MYVYVRQSVYMNKCPILQLAQQSTCLPHICCYSIIFLLPLKTSLDQHACCLTMEHTNKTRVKCYSITIVLLLLRLPTKSQLYSRFHLTSIDPAHYHNNSLNYYVTILVYVQITAAENHKHAKTVLVKMRNPRQVCTLTRRWILGLWW